MVKKIQSIAILVLFLSNLLLASRYGLNPLNLLAIALSGLVLVLQVIGGKRHE